MDGRGGLEWGEERMVREKEGEGGREGRQRMRERGKEERGREQRGRKGESDELYMYVEESKRDSREGR